MVDWLEQKKEGNVLFNDTLNTFYLWLCGVRHVVKDLSDSERGNLLPPHGLLFPISSKGLYASSHRQDNTYHSLCHGALAGARNSSMGPPHEGSIRRPIAPWANTLTTELHLAPWSSNASCQTFFLMESMERRLQMKTRQWTSHCQRTNLVGEACFADLDYSMFKNRRASLHHHSTSTCWRGTKWLTGLNRRVKQNKYNFWVGWESWALRCINRIANKNLIVLQELGRKEGRKNVLFNDTLNTFGWTRNTSMIPPHEGSIQRPIAPWANALTTELHLAPPGAQKRNGQEEKRKARRTCKKRRETQEAERKHHSVCNPPRGYLARVQVTSFVFFKNRRHKLKKWRHWRCRSTMRR